MNIVRLLLILTAVLILAGVQARPGEPPVAEAAFPGENGKIVFKSSGGTDLWLMDGDGTNPLLLDIPGDPFPGRVAWSPTGDEFVFLCGQMFCFMNAEGAGLRTVSAPSGADAWADWSDEGIIFPSVEVTGNEVGWGLTVMDPAGTVLRRISTSRQTTSVRWFPDGSGIAYLESDEAGGVQVWTADLDGSDAVQRTDLVAINSFSVDVSPDSQHLIFGVNDFEVPSALDLAVINRDGTGFHKIVSAGNPVDPIWSPDGTRIAYSFYDRNSAQWSIRTAGTDGSNPTNLSSVSGVQGVSPSWQPLPPKLVDSVEFTQATQEWQTLDELQTSLGGAGAAGITPQAFPGENGRIVFVSNTQAGLRIASINADGSDLRILTDRLPSSSAIARVSPDGDRIVYDATLSDSTSFTDLFSIKADGSDLKNLTNSPSDAETRPAWSPDGQRIAFLKLGDLWLMDADGTNSSQFTSDKPWLTSGGSPSWSPDGTQIALTGQDTGIGAVEIYSVAVQTGAITNLTNMTGTGAFFPDWSPDGQKIVFEKQIANGNTDIWVMDRNGGNPHPVLTRPDFQRFPHWSPDGTKVVYTENADGQLRIVSAGGTGPITTIPSTATAYYPDWGPVPPPPIVHSVEFTQAIQQWQTLDELQADLAGDGHPPVPIVAGKPAVMRIYMSEVEEETEYEVEVTGDVNDSRFVTLTSDCTPQERRAGESAFCQSLDVGFTPPSGDWSATLKVRRQQDSDVLEEHEFNLTSVETVPLILKPVTVCDRVDPNTGVWTCGSLFDFVNLLPFLRATFPGKVSVAGSSATIYVDRDEIPAGEDWWEVVTDSVKALWTADGAFNNVYEYGVVRPQADPGTTGGLAYDTANAAAGRTSLMRDDQDGGLPQETAHELIAHLLGLNMGLERVPSSGGCYGQPAESDADWPNGSSPEIGETGFDIAEDEPVSDINADVMSLCTPRWISPYTYNNVIDKFRLLTAASATAGLTQGDFWLVSGLHDQVTGDTEFDPLFQLETEGSDEPGTGDYSVEVRDAGGGVLFTRHFNVDTVRREDEGAEQPADPTIVRFAELVPVQVGAAKIVMLSASDEVGEIVLGGATPVVELTSGVTSAALPAGAPPLPVFSWTVQDGDSAEHSFWLELSRDGGVTWAFLAPRYAGNALTIDPALVGGGAGLLLRILASDGANTGSAVSEPFNLQVQAPQGAIATPAGGSEFDPGDVVWLQAAVVDPEDGFLDGASVQWSSSRNGSLGTGASLPVYGLSFGSHTITMTAQDSDGHDLADSITVVVSGGPAGDAHLWGDNDCDGGISSRDNQALSRLILQQNTLSQTQPCPALGAVVAVSGAGTKAWGDLDCDGQITSRDGQSLLRKVLQQNALSQTQPCPVLGDEVTTAPAAIPVGRLRWWR